MALVEGDAFHDCQRCRQDKLQQTRGCPDLGLVHPEIIFDLDGEIIQHCLVREVTAESLMWLQTANYLEAGILPEAGGLNDQWEIDLRACALIHNEREAVKKQTRQ